MWFVIDAEEYASGAQTAFSTLVLPLSLGPQLSRRLRIEKVVLFIAFQLLDGAPGSSNDDA